MSMVSKSKLAVIAIIAGAVAASTASAALVIRVQVLGGPGNPDIFDQSFTDGQDGMVDGVAQGIVFAQGGFSSTVNFATSNAANSIPTGILQTTTITARNNTPGVLALRLTVSDTNFAAPGLPGTTYPLFSSVGATFFNARLNDRVDFQSFADANNNIPVVGNATPLQTFFASGLAFRQEAFSSDVQSSFARTNSPFYSLANVTFITLSPNAQVNISGTTSTIVPEPAAAGILFSLLPILSRRRRNS